MTDVSRRASRAKGRCAPSGAPADNMPRRDCNQILAVRKGDSTRAEIPVLGKPDGQVEIKPLESLPYGQVLFIGSDGVTFKYANVSQDKLKDILDAVSKGLTPPKP